MLPPEVARESSWTETAIIAAVAVALFMGGFLIST